tara:strand:+ start:122 stop:325 length:204 start_codon:yes stop_codon:yes gene_type:complete
MNKEEKLDKLLKLEKELTIMFDSDVRVALALLEEVRKLNQKEDEIEDRTADIDEDMPGEFVKIKEDE